MDEGDLRQGRRFIDPWDYTAPPGHPRVIVVCPFCPKRWQDPPFRWFWMPHDLRAHLRRHKTHEAAFWCYGCRQIVGDGMTSKWEPRYYMRNDPLVSGLALEAGRAEGVLREAIDWRRREIERLEAEITTLEDLIQALTDQRREVV